MKKYGQRKKEPRALKGGWWEIKKKVDYRWGVKKRERWERENAAPLCCFDDLIIPLAPIEFTLSPPFCSLLCHFCPHSISTSFMLITGTPPYRHGSKSTRYRHLLLPVHWIAIPSPLFCSSLYHLAFIHNQTLIYNITTLSNLIKEIYTKVKNGRSTGIDCIWVVLQVTCCISYVPCATYGAPPNPFTTTLCHWSIIRICIKDDYALYWAIVRVYGWQCKGSLTITMMIRRINTRRRWRQEVCFECF